MSGKTALGIYHNRRFHAKSTLGNVAHSFTSPLQSACVLSRNGFVGRSCTFLSTLFVYKLLKSHDCNNFSSDGNQEQGGDYDGVESVKV